MPKTKNECSQCRREIKDGELIITTDRHKYHNRCAAEILNTLERDLENQSYVHVYNIGRITAKPERRVARK